jgi:hypothetical protein
MCVYKHKAQLSQLFALNNKLRQLYEPIGGVEFMKPIPLGFSMFPEETLCETDVIAMYCIVLQNFEFGLQWIADAGFDNEEDERIFREKLFLLKEEASSIVR